MGADEAFCLKWNDFQGSISNSLGSLRESQLLLDVTLQCGGESLTAHRLVLSACSDWFKSVFRCLGVERQHPVIVLWETAAADMALLLDFMYNGEVNVKQERLTGFLALAERLSVRGLSQGETGGSKIESQNNVEKGNRQINNGSWSDRKDQITDNKLVKGDHKKGVSQFSGGQVVSSSQIVQRPRSEHSTPDRRGDQVTEVKQEPDRSFGEETGATSYGGQLAVVDYNQDEYYNESYQESNKQNSELNKDHQSTPQRNKPVQPPFNTYSSSPNRFNTAPNRTEYQQEEPESMMGDIGVANFCNICGREYANLKQHQDDVHNPNKQPVNCPVCGKVFASKNSMRVHKSTMHRTGDQIM